MNIILSTNLSLSYIRTSKSDSALAILKSAMKVALKKNDISTYYDLVMVHATANFYLEKYPETLDSLHKFISNYSGVVLVDRYYLMGKIHQYRNNKPLMLKYFKRIDSIHKNIKQSFSTIKIGI